MKNSQIMLFCITFAVIAALLLLQEIELDRPAQTFLEKSSRYVGVQHPHEMGFTGKGIRIAVIDTGVDYNHPDLFGLGPDHKVVGGYDFIENDDTPIDTNGHGTEVAGIIAANGKMVGIAPDAKILSYRVSDSGNSVASDLIIRAIEKAVEDDADIINISLGVNRTNNKIEEAINDAVKKGVIVVAAAGNSGPDPNTIGSPGKDPHAITVGATYNNITASLVATLEVDGERFQVLPMVGMPQLGKAIEAQIVFGGYGRESDLVGTDAEGKILLVERGSDVEGELIYFTEKERNSASAGARAVIVYNSEPGIFLGDLRNDQEGPEYEPQIPIVSMSREDGLHIKEALQNKTVGTLNTFYHPDFVSFFSSRGPVSPFYIKPDLVAPGVFVNATTISGGYNLTSGTSFAAPHVSGTIALLLEKHPDLTPLQASSIITTTSDPVSDTFGTKFPYEVSGAGRLNATRAFEANTAILPQQAIFDLSPFSERGTVSFSFQTLDGSLPEISADAEFVNEVAEFEIVVSEGTMQATAILLKQDTGSYQGSIRVSDGKTSYRIPVIVRVSDAAVDVSSEEGRLAFDVQSVHDWSYAKVSVYDTDAMLVSTGSITPARDDTIQVYKPGRYWVETELRTHNDTISVYSTVTVGSPIPRPILDPGQTGIPVHAAIIIGGAVTILVIIGIYLRKS